MKYFLFLIFVGQLLMQGMSMSYAVKVSNSTGMFLQVGGLALMHCVLFVIGLKICKTRWEDGSKSGERHLCETFAKLFFAIAIPGFLVAWLIFGTTQSIGLTTGITVATETTTLLAALISAFAGAFFSGLFGTLISFGRACESPKGE